MAGSARPGATPLGDGRCAFRVWAPMRERVAVRRVEDGRTVALERTARGWHEGVLDDCPPGTRYRLVLDDALELADPASRHQPEGVHGPSAVVSRDFDWSDDDWRGVPLADLVFYELHVGTFSDEGTFELSAPGITGNVEAGYCSIQSTEVPLDLAESIGAAVGDGQMAAKFVFDYFNRLQSSSKP